MSRSGSRGSRRPPSERLRTRAPRSTAQRIACASASSEIERSGRTTFATSSSAGNAIPAIPWLLFSAAAISPATKVPCPTRSVVPLPPTKLRAPTILPANSGWVPSIPESMIPTRTGDSSGGSGQRSKAWSSCRYHCRAASGSFGVNARRRRRIPSHSTYRTPATRRTPRTVGASTTRTCSGARRYDTSPGSFAATRVSGTPRSTPTANRAPCAGAASASASAATAVSRIKS